MAIIDKIKFYVLRFLVFIFFVSLIFQIVNGLWPISSMFLFGGRVVFENIYFKFFILISTFSILMIKRNKMINNDFKNIFVFFLFYFIFEFFYFKFYLNYNWKVILFGYNAIYFYFFLIPFLFLLQGLISEKTIIKILVVLFVLSSFLGILQNYLNNPIIPTGSLDGRFRVLVYNFYSNVRAFSFFKVSITFAIFCSFLSLIFIQKLDKNRPLYVFLFLISAYCVYISYSRTGYLVFVFSLINYWFINKNYNIKFISKLPIIYFILGLFFVFFLFIVGDNVNEKSILNWEKLTYQNKNDFVSLLNNKNFNIISFNKYENIANSKKFELNIKRNIPVKKPYILSKDSLKMRIISWKEYTKIMLGNMRILFFGTGIYGNRNVELFNKFCLDNFYLEILFHSGLLGFVIVFMFLYKIWRFIVSYDNSSILVKANVSMFPTLFLSGFFGYILPIYLSYLCFVFVVKPKTNYEKN